jgi:glycosyltransferase involved in cell wall biosynthesis
MRLSGPISTKKVSAVIPCLNEEVAIGGVVTAVLAEGVDEVVVVDGASTDRTVEKAQGAGARVVIEPRRGYGRAIRAGIAAIDPTAEIVLFLDGDGSDRPEMIKTVLAPLISGDADFVLGSRVRGNREQGSLSMPQIIVGHLAGTLIWLLYGARFTDMSPFRAIGRAHLDALGMQEETFGWNLEMQMRVAAAGLHIMEVPVGQRRRAGGVSKVSRNVGVATKVVFVLGATCLRLVWMLRREAKARTAP